MKEESISKVFIHYLIRYLFLPARVEQRRILPITLLSLVVILGILLIIFSFPPVTKFVWMHQFSSIDRNNIINNKEQIKAWLSSATYTLDIFVALLIGGSIFGERLAKSFKKTLDNYQRARSNILGDKLEELENELKESAEKISELSKSLTLRKQLSALPRLYKETKHIYQITFKEVPTFYKHYLRFILYSSFPGGLYGLVAFLVFIVSCILKLILIYLDSPYLVINN